MTTATGNRDDDMPFTCLAIELATGVGSVAACAGARTSSCEYPSDSMQSRDIYGGVHDVLEELGLELNALHCVAFGCGPGAFTGLRVAAAVAQALAYGACLPVVRVSSLAALAIAARRRHGADCIVPCFDARMGEAYLAVYNGVASGDAAPGGLHQAVPDCLIDPGQFRLSADLAFFAVGPGWSAYPELAANHAAQIIGSDHALVPSAVDVLALAAGEYRQGRTIPAVQALPNYIRDKVT